MAYAGWLLRQNRAAEALGVVQGVREEKAKEEVGRKWRELLKANEQKEDEDEEMAVEA